MRARQKYRKLKWVNEEANQLSECVTRTGERLWVDRDGGWGRWMKLMDRDGDGR
jgi:ribosomal protein L17